MSESNGKLLAFIHDGYTRDGYIARHDLLYPAAKFKYRPVLVQERSDILFHHDNTQDRQKRDSVNAVHLARHLCWWDITDHRDQAVEITAENVLRLQPELYWRLFQIVCTGTDGGDHDPQWTQDQKRIASQRDAFTSVHGGLPAVAEAALAGN